MKLLPYYDSILKNSLLTLILSLNIFCFKTSEQESVKYQDRMNLISIFAIATSAPPKEYDFCDKPNAVKRCELSGCICTDKKLTQGLIFQEPNLVMITTDTLTSYATLRCLCPDKSVSEYFNWNRGNSIIDNPGINPSVSDISGNYYTAGIRESTGILNQSQYSKKDNLYCLSTCNINDTSARFYQFLKVRIP